MKSSLSLSLVALILSGCATMTDRKRHQYVYIQSNPPGATVLDDGEAIGTTPGLVRLTRHRSHELVLQQGTESKNLPLKTKYAWNESFFSNMIFLSLAPAGWLTDFFSGAGFNYQDPEVVNFSKPVSAIKFPPPRLALAPPLADSYALSDEAAQYWEKQLPKTYPDGRLVPYRETLETFQKLGYDYDERPSDEQLHRETLSTLKVDQIFLSSVQSTPRGAEMQGQLKDTTGKNLDEKKAQDHLANADVWQSTAQEYLPSWFQFVPNTIGLELSNNSTVLTEKDPSGNNDGRHGSAETGEQDSFSKSLTYMQALTLSRLQRPRLDRSGRWKFQFVPTARLSYKKIFFPEFTKLAYVNFNYLLAGAGIGPEAGYQTGKHYYYGRFIPLWIYSQIDWQQPSGGHESTAVGRLGTQVELGYLYFLNDRLSLRFFIKSTSASSDHWNSVAHKINPTTSDIDSSTDSYVGLGLGYTFDTRDRLFTK